MVRRAAVIPVSIAMACLLTASSCEGRTRHEGAFQKVSGSTVVSDECKKGDGRKVEQLDDYKLRGVTSQGTHAEAQKVGDTTVQGFEVAAVKIDDITIDGGCIIRHDAPAGCVGAVEITSTSIPAATIPGFSFRRGAGADITAPQVSAQGTSLQGQKVDQVCPPANNPGAVIFRGSAHRPSGYRPALFRAGTKAGQVCSGDQCVETPAVPSVVLEAVTIPAVTVDAQTNGDSATPGPQAKGVVYVGSADVFFDVDRATLRPAAVLSLRRISDRIRRTKDNVTVTVEGHTDDTGSAQHNLQLSQARARSVADWLRRNGNLGSRRISTHGYGETRPAVPNTSDAGRQANRRVVISAD